MLLRDHNTRAPSDAQHHGFLLLVVDGVVMEIGMQAMARQFLWRGGCDFSFNMKVAYGYLVSLLVPFRAYKEKTLGYLASLKH